MTPGSMTKRKDGFAGCLLGVMVGDSLGSRVQGFEQGLVEQRFSTTQSLCDLEPGPYGAATLMTWALASSSISTAPDFSAEDLAERLAAVYNAERGFGRGTARVLARLCAGQDWQQAAAGPGGRSSFGNGAATRAAPLGLMFAEDADRLRWTAERAAAVTHEQVLGTEGAVLQAFAVATGLRAAGRKIDGEGFLRSLAGHCRTREFAARMRTGAELVGRKNLRRKAIVGRLGNASTALGSVATAAFCFALHPDSFEDAVVAALALGGASCSIVSMTAAISGAYLGAEAIPRRWLDACGDEPLSVARFETLADDLAELNTASAAAE